MIFPANETSIYFWDFRYVSSNQMVSNPVGISWDIEHVAGLKSSDHRIRKCLGVIELQLSEHGHRIHKDA